MKKQLVFGIATAVLAMGSAAMADTYSTSGAWENLNGATFGGTGIPTDPSQVTTITDTLSSGASGGTITLGLTASQRYFNAPLGNDGGVNSTFYATTGANYGDPTGNTKPSPSLGSTWNLDFFVNNNAVGNYTFLLVYTAPAGAGTGIVPSPIPITPVGGIAQDSQNIVFNGFNPYATGIYTFTLEAFNGPSSQGNLIGSDTINVDVVPEVSSTALLFCLTLGGLGVYSRMRRQSVA